MKLIAIPLERVPSFAFAHSYRAEANSGGWDLPSVPGMVEITYVKEGALVRSDGRQTVTVSAGQVSCLNRAKHWVVEGPGERHVHYTVAFQTEGIKETDEVAGGLCAYLPPTLERENTAGICADIQQLITLHNENPLHTAAMLLTLLSDITNLAHQLDKTENPICCRAKRLLSEGPETALAPAALASRLGVSYGYLSRLFRQQENMTLTEYVNRKRLEHVRELLYLSDMTLEQAGRSAGFADVKYLSRLFHKIYGCTAREYIAFVRQSRKSGGRKI